MKLSALRGVSAAILALALIVLGCESATDPAASPQVEIEKPVSSLLLEEDSEGEESELDILRRDVELLTEQVASALIGPEGGTLSILGHQLTVPVGAVAEVTQFVMIVLPGTEVIVDLYAFDPELGTNVGENGFLVPVQLALSYDGVSGITDPSTLLIVHLDGEGGREELETEVDEEKEIAEADLEHFSRYALCRN